MRLKMSHFALWVSLILSPILNAAGVATMGLANSNADFKMLPGEGPQDALRRALNISGEVHILPGIYQFTAPLTGAFNGVRIIGTKNSVLVPATSGSVGLFNLTGNGITIENIKIRSTSFVASQTFANFSDSKDVTFRGVTFEVTVNALADSSQDGVITPVAAPTGNTSTPMVCVEFTRVLRKTIDNCVFLPDYAVTCVKSTDGAGIKIVNSHFANDFEAGLSGLALDAGPTVAYAENAPPRLCWRGIQIDGDEWGLIQGNRFFGLGDSNYLSTPYYTDAPYELDYLIQIKRSTSVPAGGLLTAQSEAGHIRVIGNSTEWCAAPKAIKVLGALSVTFVGNLLGLNPSANAAGEGNIIITDVDEGGSGTDLAGAIDILSNNIHNPGSNGTDAAAIVAQQVSDLSIHGNTIGACVVSYPIRISGSTCESVSIIGNSFRANSPTKNPIYITTGAGISNGIHVGFNNYEGFATTVAADDPGTGVITASGTGTAGVDDFMGTVATTAYTITRTAGSFVTEGWVPGDVFTAAGLDTAADNSKPLVVRSVAALTLTLEGYPLTADADNGTDVVLTETSAACVVNDSSSVADYFLDGMMTKNKAPHKAITSTGVLTNITIASNVITRAAGSFLTDGFEVGDMASIGGALATAADINKVGYVSAVTALTMTLTNVSISDDGSAGEDTVIMKVGGNQSSNVSLD